MGPDRPNLVENNLGCSFQIRPQLITGLELFIDHLGTVSLRTRKSF
jgi:hypothetical protein